MKTYIQTMQQNLIEKQIIHDVLFDNDLWLKIYKVLEPEDFYFYKNVFEALCKIFEDKGKISPAYLLDLDIKISEFIEEQVLPTSSFFDDMVVILRDKRIEKEIKQLLNEKDITNLKEKIEKLERKRLSSQVVKSINQSVSDYYENYAERKDNYDSGKSLLLQTGFKQFDEKIGLTRGELVTLAARTGIGKSAFTLNLALNVASHEKKVLFVSVEMSEDQLFERIFARETQLACDIFKYSKFDIDKFGKVADKIQEKYKELKIIHIPQATSTAISTIARKIGGVDLIVVDYLQILKDPIKRNETNAIRIGEMTGRFKRLALELNCVVISVSQVNRDASRGLNKEPELHQLRDSGSIEQDSDKVIFIDRDKGNMPNLMKLYVAKNRSGQENISINYNANLQTMTFNEK